VQGDTPLVQRTGDGLSCLRAHFVGLASILLAWGPWGQWFPVSSRAPDHLQVTEMANGGRARAWPYPPGHTPFTLGWGPTMCYVSGSLWAWPSPGPQHQQSLAPLGAMLSFVSGSRYGHLCSCSLPLPCVPLPCAGRPHALPRIARILGVAALSNRGRYPGAGCFESWSTPLSPECVPN